MVSPSAAPGEALGICTTRARWLPGRSDRSGRPETSPEPVVLPHVAIPRRPLPFRDPDTLFEEKCGTLRRIMSPRTRSYERISSTRIPQALSLRSQAHLVVA